MLLESTVDLDAPKLLSVFLRDGYACEAILTFWTISAPGMPVYFPSLV
jgi:hypothetical protein